VSVESNPVSIRPAQAALLLAVAVLFAAPAARAGGVPPLGTQTTIDFCGIVEQVPLCIAMHVMKANEPYAGSLVVTQRNPDGDDGTLTTWLCEDPGSECGELRVVLPGFKPPQTHPEVVEIVGSIESIAQTATAYRTTVDMDDFVAGAIGAAELELVCPGCSTLNVLGSIAPDFHTAHAQIHGVLTVDLAVPGIGGSLAPPCGADTLVVASIDGLGAECNRVVPSTSTRGLAALVVLMIAASVAAAPWARRGSR